ncbi:MAG: RES domain-containing protein [Thiobacillus sp.]|nr:RES domain-containing protein [Thiobacillus sp.]
MTYPTTRLKWNPAYRVIPSRFPAVGLFERVARPEDFDALYALEAMTNDRIRDEVGEISLVPAAERLFGPGSTCIMAAFTHLNPHGSRFSDGSYGVFYCARKRDTAIAETRYHAARFMAATQEPSMRLQMRLYSVEAHGKVADLRKASQAEPRIVDPDDYAYPQSIGRTLRAEGAHGILYPSVRYPGGECLAAFRTVLLKSCLHAATLEYNWNGQGIDAVFEVNQVL